LDIIEKPEKKLSKYNKKFDELLEIIKLLHGDEKIEAIQLLIKNLNLEKEKLSYDQFDELSFNNLFINFEEFDNIPGSHCLENF